MKGTAERSVKETLMDLGNCKYPINIWLEYGVRK